MQNSIPSGRSICRVCEKGSLNEEPFLVVEEVPYHECESCGSIYIADATLISNSRKQIYSSEYWNDEIASSRSRSYGSTLARIAEVFLYARIEIERFIDIGCGPGLSLDAIGSLMPEHSKLFYGCELYPPPLEFRTTSENYMTTSLGDCGMTFSAGICIEVIEHMFPEQIHMLAKQIQASSKPGAIYYFNSAQPSHVRKNDLGYLDPYRRGHVASYSIEGLASIFSKYDLTVLPLHGREWAFLLEYKSNLEGFITAQDLLKRIWTANESNINKLKHNGFGPLLHTIAIESARCYLEAAISEQRAHWAQSLAEEIAGLRNLSS